MKIEDDGIYAIIVKSFSEQLTTEDTDRLNFWLNADQSNKMEYADYAEIWKGSHRMKLRSKIDLVKTFEHIQKRAGIKTSRFRIVPVLVNIAAVLVIALLLSVFYNMYLKPGHQTKIELATYQQVKTTYGTQTRIELPDSTVVYLNSGSTLRFPNSFNKMKTRNVDLIGEGFFLVKKNSEQPFIVSIRNIQIKVLGTTFNVNAYPNNQFFTIALEEGKIQLGQKRDNGTVGTLNMKKNQVCTYNQSGNKFSISDEMDVNKYTGWTTGKIIFYNDDVQTVLVKLENWYNVDIKIGDKNIEKYRFTGTFIDEPIEQVLNLLSLSSRMQYKVYSAKKLANNTFSKRKIILTSK